MMVSSCALSFEDETIIAKDMTDSEVIQSIQTIVIINK